MMASQSGRQNQDWKGIRKARLALLLAVGLLILSVPVSAHAQAVGIWPTLKDIRASSWVVMDRATGEVLLSDHADLQVYPASTTKIMTAVLALEAGNLDRTVLVSPEAVKLPAGSSKVGYLAGEEVFLRDVLYGMMVASGNDAANILAEALAGSQAAFADMMNAKAVSLGLTGSHFMNPSGLQDPEHYVTARDMAKLAAYAMENADFRKLVSTCSYSLPPTNLHPYYGWAIFNNTNRLMIFGDTFYKSDLIANVEGVKTGSTNNAGNNLVVAATTVSGQKLVSVLFGVPDGTQNGNIFTYSRTLLEEVARLNGTTPTATTTATATETTAGTAETTATQTTTQGTSTNSSSTASPSTGGTTSQTASPSDPDRLAGLQHEMETWRSASIILVTVWLMTVLMVGVYLIRLRRSRLKIRSRRIKTL